MRKYAHGDTLDLQSTHGLRACRQHEHTVYIGQYYSHVDYVRIRNDTAYVVRLDVVLWWWLAGWYDVVDVVSCTGAHTIRAIGQAEMVRER